MLTIDFLTDYVCPFCLVTKENLRAALKTLHQEAEIIEHPYALTPEGSEPTELEVLAELRLLYLAFAHRKPRIDLLHPAIRIHFSCSFSVYGTTSTTVSVSPSTTKRISTSPYGTPYTRFPSC